MFAALELSSEGFYTPAPCPAAEIKVLPCHESRNPSRLSRHHGDLQLREHHPDTLHDQTDTVLVDVCSACHPFYTGTQKIVDTAGRIDKFRRRYGT